MDPRRPQGADSSGLGPGNVPAPITTFVGRNRELNEIAQLLKGARLVTLTGVGGVGKTRVATQAAATLAPEFPEGVWVIELAALRDPALLPHTIVDTLSIPQRSARNPMTTLIEFLSRRRILLVLDNCEHLLDSAASVVDELLRAADRLHILTTSRQRLGLTGEVLFQIAPLDVPAASTVPDAEQANGFDALRLFADRASTVVPGFDIDATNVAAVTRVCRRLEGIPLALELAAVRLRVLAVDDLATRLEDRFVLLVDGGRTAPERHRTLRAMVDWSYDLCTSREQQLWSRAAIFAGSFDLDAAESVCADDDLPRDQILDTLAGLIDKSIIIAEQSGGHARFRLLETIREYGLARLAKAGTEQRFRARHRDWYLLLIDQSCAEWFGPSQRLWCVRLRTEQPNLRAAFDFSIAAADDVEAGLKLVGKPWFLWVCLFLAEGRHWLDRALHAPSPESVHRLRAITTAGYVTSLQGDRSAADALLAEAAAGQALVADSEIGAYTEHVRGVYSLFFGDALESGRVLAGALARYEDEPGVPEDLRVVAQIQLGLSKIFLGDVDGASDLFEECRNRCEAVGEQWLLSYALYGLALARFADGEYPSAAEFVHQSLRIKRVFGDSLGLAMALDLAAWIHAEQGEHAPAATLLGAAADLWQTFGVELFGSSHWLVYRRRCEGRARNALGSAFQAAFDLGAGLGIDDALRFAVTPEPIAAASGSPPGQIPLTEREHEVADLVARGLANRAIAAELHISQRTAETHVQHILTKLGFQSRAQIATWVGERRGRAASPAPRRIDQRRPLEGRNGL